MIPALAPLFVALLQPPSVAAAAETPPSGGDLGFGLLRTEWWPLLGVSVLVAVVGTLGLFARRRERARLVHPRQLARFLPGVSDTRATTRVALAATAAALIALSFLGPVRGWTQRDIVQRGVDLVLCVDTSRSMLARDLRPNRLARAAREVSGVLEHMAGDRVALLAFSGDVREIAPLTHDRAVIRGLAKTLSHEDNRRGGTDLGAALERALELFDGRTGAHEAVVFLTDGEDLEGRGAEVAQVAAERGIRVYVVGLGTVAGGKIPISNEDGSEAFVRGPDGQEVVSRLEGSSLATLAELTGGAYLSTENSPTPLEDLYTSRISRLDERSIEGGKEWVGHDRFQWSLVLALACMLAEVGLRERRRDPRPARVAPDPTQGVRT